QAEAMIDDESAARQVQVGLGERDDAVSRCCERGADRPRDIDPHMRRARLPVQYALAAIDAADHALNRPDEARLEEGVAYLARTRLVEERLIVRDALQYLGRGRHHGRGQAVDALYIVMTLLDGEHALLVLPIRMTHREGRIRLCVPVEAEDEMPVVGDLDRLTVERHFRLGFGDAEDESALRHFPLDTQRAGNCRRCNERTSNDDHA